MTGKTAASGIFKILGVFLLLLLFSGVGAAEETTTVSPTVILSFDNVPDSVINGASVTVNTGSALTDDMKNLLKEENSHITNVAYVVKLTPNGISDTEVKSTQIRMPVSSTWASAYSNVYIAAIEQNTVQLYDATDIGTITDPVYQATMEGVPDYVLLIAADESISSDAASTPAPILGVLFGLLVCAIIRRHT